MRSTASKIVWASLVIAVAAVTGCGKSAEGVPKVTTSISGENPESASPDASSVTLARQTPADLGTAAYPLVRIETNKGTIVVELRPDWAWKTVDNFLEYVGEKHYDGTIFHTAVKDRAIVGGGFTPELREKTETLRTPIMNEARDGYLKGAKNLRGTVAMIRRPDSAHSAQAQFFINLADNPNLDYKSSTDAEYGYCVFGRVKEGLEIAEAISAVPVIEEKRADQQFPQLPQATIVIKSIQAVQPEFTARRSSTVR